MSRCGSLFLSLSLSGAVILCGTGELFNTAPRAAPVYEYSAVEYNETESCIPECASAEYSIAECGNSTDEQAGAQGGALDGAEEELSEIYEKFLELVPGSVAELGEALSGGEGILDLFSVLGEPFAAACEDFCHRLLLFFAVSLIMCLGELLAADTELLQSTRGVLSMILSLPVIGVMSDTLSSVLEGLDAAGEFFSGVMPLLTATVAIGVGGTTAAASAAGMSITLSLTEGIICENLYLLFGAIFALSLIGNFDAGQGTASFARGVRNCFNFLMGAVTLIIGGTLAMQTTLAASRDTLLLRSAKYAISGMVPVVGGIVSGSIGTLLSGAKILSATIGTLGVVAVIYYMAAPLITLLLMRLCMGACIVFSSFVGASFGGKFFESVRGAVDCLIAPFASSLIIYILELMIFSVTVSSV